MHTRNPKWAREELMLALDLYFRLGPTGASKTHRDVSELSRVLRKLAIHGERPDPVRFRNPNGVHMKLANFLRFDPAYEGTGLAAGGKDEADIWAEFSGDRERLRRLADGIRARVEPSPAYLLTWNPKHWPWDTFADELRTFQENAFLDYEWSCQSTQVKIADRVFFMRQGEEPRGVFASAKVTQEPHEREHWDGSGRRKLYVGVRFDALLDPERDEILPRSRLLTEPPLSTARWDTQSSGIRIPHDARAALEDAWQELLSAVGTQLPEQVPDIATFNEGAKIRITVNAYERNAGARSSCIEHHGACCAVCGLDLGELYGAISEGYVHVHHLTPLSEIDGQYEVDPIQDLRPICPNCHAMIHRRRPPYTIGEIADLMRRARTGSSVSSGVGANEEV